MHFLHGSDFSTNSRVIEPWVIDAAGHWDIPNVSGYTRGYMWSFVGIIRGPSLASFAGEVQLYVCVGLRAERSAVPEGRPGHMIAFIKSIIQPELHPLVLMLSIH